MREDGHTVELKMVITRYVGKRIEFDENGVAKLPVFHLDEQIVTSAVVWDAQTVAVSKRFDGKMVVILVTPTLIAPDGNRVHHDSGQ